MHSSYQKSHWRKMLRLSDQIDQVDFYYLISCAILRPLFIIILYIIKKNHISKSQKNEVSLYAPLTRPDYFSLHLTIKDLQSAYIN